MSSRALRKAQREKEEQDRLKALDEIDDTDDDQGGVSTITPQKSAFAMLDELDDDNDEDENSESDHEATAQAAPSSEILSQPTATKKTRKKKKKAKAAKQSNMQTTSDQVRDMDDIDAALRELAIEKSTAPAQTASGVDPAFNEACRLLAVDRNFLHAQNEMRKLFGRAAVEQDNEAEAPAQAAGNRRQQRQGQQIGLAQAIRGQRGQGRGSGAASIGLKRNIFIQGKEDWPAATSGGLGMEIVNKAANGTIEYRYVHNRAYQDVQAQFEACVASMDPNRMVVLWQHNPYHVSSLLQVSEIARSERDATTAGDLLERALFTMGRAVHSTFAKSLADGKARLDFRRPENREFWLAGWRYMLNLSMRGTWRTVYEWGRLLLALSPEEDPYAIWLTLDQYALRSKQDLDYINLSRNALMKPVHEDMPNVLLSQGLAEYRSGDRSKGQQALFSTISKYPWFVAHLMHELDVNSPPAIWGKEPSTDTERMYAELYAVRAKDIWNTPENSALLLEIASAVPAEAKQADSITSEIGINDARQIVQSELPALIALIPKKYKDQYTSVSDPLPPADSLESYTTTNKTQPGIGSVEDYREFQQLNNFFRSLLPRLMQGRNPEGDGTLEVDEAARLRLEENNISEAELMQRLTRLRDLGGRDYTPTLEALDDQFDQQSEDEDEEEIDMGRPPRG